MRINRERFYQLKHEAEAGDIVAQCLLAAGILVLYSIDNIPAKSANLIVTSKRGDAVAAALAIAAQPDVPRNLRVITGSAWDGGKVTVTGTDARGFDVTEEFTGAAGQTYVGKKMFKTVTSVVKAAHGVDATGNNTVTVGTGDSIACGDFSLANAFGQLKTDGGDEACVFDADNNSFTPTTVPNGAHDYQVLIHIK